MIYKNLLNILEYFFPKNSSWSKKITDIKWIRKLVPIAPYLAIALSLSILIWGVIASDATKFIIKPHFVVFLGVAFWTTICLIVTALLKKRDRSPAVSSLLALFFPLKGICALVFFLGMQSSIKEASKGLKQESAHFSQEVQSKIQERRTSISQRSQEKEAEVQAHREHVQQSIRNISRHFEGSFERFRATHEEIKEWMNKRVAESEQRTKEMDKIYWDSVHRRQEKFTGENANHFLFSFKPKPRKKSQ